MKKLSYNTILDNNKIDPSIPSSLVMFLLSEENENYIEDGCIVLCSKDLYTSEKVFINFETFIEDNKIILIKIREYDDVLIEGTGMSFISIESCYEYIVEILRLDIENVIENNMSRKAENNSDIENKNQEMYLLSCMCYYWDDAPTNLFVSDSKEKLWEKAKEINKDLTPEREDFDEGVLRYEYENCTDVYTIEKIPVL